MTDQTQTLERPAGASESIAAANQEPEWLRRRRADAAALYASLAMPRDDEEDWRRTDLRGLNLRDFETYKKPGAKVDDFAALPDGLRATTAPGDFAGTSYEVDSTSVFRELGSEAADAGIVFTDLHTAARDHSELLEKFLNGADGVAVDADKFMAMHAAFMAGGNFIHVPKGVHLEKAIKCTYWLDDPAVAAFPHTLVVVEPEASVAIIDEYISAPSSRPAFAAPVTEAHLGRASRLNYVSLQRWSQDTWNMSRQRFVFDDEAKASLLFAALGSRTTKAYVQTIFKGASSSARMKGLIVGDNDQSIDYQTLQEHAGVASESDLDFKAALKDRSRAIWLGLCVITKTGQRSNANQTCRNLLLSEKASAFPIPSLEILANDVKCSHGTTVGQVDEQQIFYAQTRGIDREAAERMIVDGFFQPLVDSVSTEGVRDLLHEVLEQRLEL
ncbi:MAG: Fe-S cluster assembly protein SufD [Dehalococcoidia bacterium]